MVDRITSERADSAFAPEQAAEQAAEPQPLDESSSSNLGKAGEVAGKVAVAAMLASTLTATTPNEVDFPLPEATPIVYVLHPDGPDAVPESPADDEQFDSKAAIWKKILEILKYLLLVLALVAGIVIAATNGCTTCSGPVAAPVDQSSSSSAAS